MQELKRNNHIELFMMSESTDTNQGNPEIEDKNQFTAQGLRERRKSTDEGNVTVEDVNVEKKGAQETFESVKEQGQQLLSESKHKMENVLHEGQKTIHANVEHFKGTLKKKGYNTKMFLERTREGEETLRGFDVLYFAVTGLTLLMFPSILLTIFGRGWTPIVAYSTDVARGLGLLLMALAAMMQLSTRWRDELPRTDALRIATLVYVGSAVLSLFLYFYGSLGLPILLTMMSHIALTAAHGVQVGIW